MVQVLKLGQGQLKTDMTIYGVNSYFVKNARNLTNIGLCVIPPPQEIFS